MHYITQDQDWKTYSGPTATTDLVGGGGLHAIRWFESSTERLIVA